MKTILKRYKLSEMPVEVDFILGHGCLCYQFRKGNKKSREYKYYSFYGKKLNNRLIYKRGQKFLKGNEKNVYKTN